MRKTIGVKIRELRRRDNVTQEKLAEALNVSYQSVSRWENDMTYPDISLIPVIARFFQVTTDELFDLNNAEYQKSKVEYEERYRNLRKDGKIGLCRELMEEARKEFPRDFHIMMNLAETLELYEEGTKAQKEEFAAGKYAGQIDTLCQNVLEECREEEERCRAVKLLCGYYVKTGNHGEALQLVKGVADMEHCRERLLEQILTGAEKIQQLQSNLLSAIDYVASTLVVMAFRKEIGLTQKLTVDEKIQYVETANQLYQLILTDGNYQFYHRIFAWNYRRLAELYQLKEEREKAYSYLLLAESEAGKYDDLREYQYTAPFVNMLVYEPDEHTKGWAGSERAMLLYRIGENENYWNGHEGVAALKKRLEQVTAKEEAVNLE